MLLFNVSVCLFLIWSLIFLEKLVTFLQMKTSFLAEVDTIKVLFLLQLPDERKYSKFLEIGTKCRSQRRTLR